MFTRKPHLRLEKFAMTCTKRFFATKSANNGLMQRSIRTIIRSPHPRRPSVLGTARPSVLAVLRLIVSASFVGNSIGKSPPLVPFRTL
jgi:hypothetical protein